MIHIKGNYSDAKVFTTDLEATAREQIQTLVNQSFTAGSTIRVMPDVHAGAGSTIGTTMTIEDKVVPNLVGVDIGCGMETARLKQNAIDYRKLDKLIYARIPSGKNIRKRPHEYLKHVDIHSLRARQNGKNDKMLKLDRASLSIGTLGGGNHFIEVNRDEEDRLYVVIHSGSRHLGLQIALYYQRQAGKLHPELPSDLAYLDGELLDDYLHDMHIIQEYAVLNRKAMMDEIVQGMGFDVDEDFTTTHNYIDLEHMILRKGAISAREGERVLIPLNMRDGSLICEGKGNPDWNYSAPHGAGRTMSRRQAHRELSLEDFRNSMKGIYSTSVRKGTLDESPEAYKPAEDIIRDMGDTVEILHHLKPVYNFKASE